MHIEVQTTQQIMIKELRIACQVGPANLSLHGKAGRALARQLGGPIPAFIDGQPDTLELHIDLKTGRILNWNEPDPAQVLALYEAFDLVPDAPKPPRQRKSKGETDAEEGEG